MLTNSHNGLETDGRWEAIPIPLLTAQTTSALHSFKSEARLPDQTSPTNHSIVTTALQFFKPYRLSLHPQTKLKYYATKLIGINQPYNNKTNFQLVVLQINFILHFHL